MVRRLGPEERALWDKVVATVRPLHRQQQMAVQSTRPAEPGLKAAPVAPSPPAPAKAQPARPGTTLDSTWDRRISRGLVQPDMSIDLHGHNLATAYALLDRRLEQAIAAGARVILLITGKPPSGERWPVKRGAIRAAVGDWLGASRYAGHIASVRNAHPRHGGQGALYIILRRPR